MEPRSSSDGQFHSTEVLDKLNVISTIHLRKLIATLVRENVQRNAIIEKLENKIVSLEDMLKEISKQHNTDVIV